MNEQTIALPTVRRWNHERLPILDKPDVAQKSFIQNLVYRFAVVDRAMRLADQTGSRGRHLSFRHGKSNSRQAPKDGRRKSVTFKEPRTADCLPSHTSPRTPPGKKARLA